MSKQSESVLCLCVSLLCLSSVLLQVFINSSFLPGVSIKRREGEGEERGRIESQATFQQEGENFQAEPDNVEER